MRFDGIGSDALCAVCIEWSKKHSAYPTAFLIHTYAFSSGAA